MDLKEIIKSIDIVEYISQFIELERRGDEWWGLSCFTDEKTPSFSVRRDPPFFYDYSSGTGGNLFTFIRKYHRCSPQKAIQIIMCYAGIEGELCEIKQEMDAIKVMKRYKITEREVKKSSGVILPDDYMERFEKRPDKTQIWVDEGISRESLEKFQVRYDSYSDRIVYPIRNFDSKIVNVGGRALGEHWKKEGQRKYTYFFSWGTINTIYGVPENMEEILKRREVIIFEGCKSVLLADTWGIKNTGAILTSHLSGNQVVLLSRLGCDVVFALDKEIRIPSDKNIRRLKKYVNVSYIYDRNGLIGAKDAPVDKGEDVFMRLYEERIVLK